MPNINRIRVNNVKYNFGTQFYDDFTMRMHGKNTLYDLANGGGKSVLMLLLLQNMIPNCTLDEKQPIEKLFRTGNGNTTIHSLIEWKLDEGDDSEGYRYMTTGFCARKAKDTEGEIEAKSNVATIEYFNYCIFYREFNKNDIVNLPLVKDGERISFQGLKSYLKELPHRDMALRVCVFDRKGEYQRFISRYGLHESQWEIIRGINKTEGHVRTYFETNYKTTRKVVEDLLIEEIIEKAYMVKTQNDEDGSDSMAKTLMDIKEQLTILAKKKKDISGYDHQIELIRLLADKVSSFMDLYEEQTKLSGLIADICVTGAEFAKNDEQQMELLQKAKDEKREQKNKQREKIENLKVARDKKQLEILKSEAAELEKKTNDYRDRLEELIKDLNMKESVNEYIEYLEDRRKYYSHDAVVKTMLAESSFDEELLFTYAYNIKMRTDVMLTDIRRQMSEIEQAITEKKAKQKYQDKLLLEARTGLAVAVSTKEQAEEEIVSLSAKLSDIRMSMNNIRFTKLGDQVNECKNELSELEDKINQSNNVIDECTRLLQKEQFDVSLLEDKKQNLDRQIAELSVQEKEYLEAKQKLDNIKTVYGVPENASIADVISDRITRAVLEREALQQKLEDSARISSRLAEGRLIGRTKAVQKLLDYIESRHNETAMYGMDYLSALPDDKQQELLSLNPELCFGIVVKNYDTLLEDPNIKNLDLGDETVNVFDMEAINEKAVYYGENAFAVHPSAEYLTDKDTAGRLLEAEKNRCQELERELEMKQEMLKAYRQDHDFVVRLYDSTFITAAAKLEEARRDLDDTLSMMEHSKSRIRDYKLTIEKANRELETKREEYEKCLSDINKLYTIEQLTEIIDAKEAIAEKNREEIERLEETVRGLASEADDGERECAEQQARYNTLERKLYELNSEWDNNYKPYYNIDQEYEVLTINNDELKARFEAMVREGSEDAKAIEDKRLLMDTLKVSMDRSLKSIEKRGVDVKILADYEARGLLYISDEAAMDVCRRGIEDARQQVSSLEQKVKNKISEVNRLEGSIEYAISNIEAAFGEYIEEEATLSEIVTNLENGEALLERLEKEARECEEELKRYSRQQGYMIDLYKDVKRIVTTNDISLENATLLIEDKEKLRDIFEENLLKFDRSTKALEKAKNELIKFKGNTASALDRMEVFELATTIREDVILPDNYDQARLLLDNLNSIVDFIVLEKDRVEKSLTDLETIKSNFEEQCLQRCLDVRTELDKLPKLSRIIMDGEAIQMVDLNIPYVKDEFLKQRMSDYIDRIVTQADDYDSDKDRIKFIRNSLALKKLFGVIVTDMNGIKLSLYKRERIREQSRYLRYEEAVGSTGQSQGIYIQFLVSIINYISGMYQVGNEDTRTKTIFIDNPFGAAKDVYIWEPIFALLAANRVQLIVPARGATPAITGRFDVNYILGQQMSGGRQLTVVSDYTSRVDQQELEYQDLEYEQVSFDFI